MFVLTLGVQGLSALAISLTTPTYVMTLAQVWATIVRSAALQ
jgi:hypothetical protein